MPSKLEHKTKADGNAALALSINLDSQPRIDWALIMLFYAAMHYVEAYLALQGVHLKSHTSRDSHLGRDSKLKPIYGEYKDLKFYGYNARYEVFGFKASDVRDEALKGFEKIKSHIAPML